MSQRGYLLNATGRELPNDMACPSTIEPFKLDKDAEEFFYDELNTLPLPERVERIIGVFERNKQLVGSLIVENNELGRTLMERLPREKFVVSVKRPNSTLHWMYSNIDRMRPLPDEWLKKALEVTETNDTDFVNIWIGKAQQSVIADKDTVRLDDLATNNNNNVIESRVPTNVQWVDANGQPKP